MGFLPIGSLHRDYHFSHCWLWGPLCSKPWKSQGSGVSSHYLFIKGAPCPLCTWALLLLLFFVICNSSISQIAALRVYNIYRTTWDVLTRTLFEDWLGRMFIPCSYRKLASLKSSSALGWPTMFQSHGQQLGVWMTFHFSDPPILWKQCALQMTLPGFWVTSRWQIREKHCHYFGPDIENISHFMTYLRIRTTA